MINSCFAFSNNAFSSNVFSKQCMQTLLNRSLYKLFTFIDIFIKGWMTIKILTIEAPTIQNPTIRMQKFKSHYSNFRKFKCDNSNSDSSNTTIKIWKFKFRQFTSENSNYNILNYDNSNFRQFKFRQLKCDNSNLTIHTWQFKLQHFNLR